MFSIYQLETNINLCFNNFEAFTGESVKKLIMKAKATTGPTDPVPSKLVKQRVGIILPLITRIVKASLGGGLFTECWKTSVYKTTDQKERTRVYGEEL